MSLDTLPSHRTAKCQDRVIAGSSPPQRPGGGSRGLGFRPGALRPGGGATGPTAGPAGHSTSRSRACSSSVETACPPRPAARSRCSSSTSASISWRIALVVHATSAYARWAPAFRALGARNPPVAGPQPVQASGAARTAGCRRGGSSPPRRGCRCGPPRRTRRRSSVLTVTVRGVAAVVERLDAGDGERLGAGEAERLGGLAGRVLQRQHAHADQVGAVDALVATRR